MLPSISKIFEYILILEQLTNHFIENNLLSPQQYSFRAKHSTKPAAQNLVDYLTYKLNHGFIPINIYIDLSKASDTLTHSILLDKLSYYGVNGVAKNLLQSYLSHSHQVVDFLVVPQGFVLGSSLFSENINELPSCTDIFNMIMYADDTTLFCDINGNPADEHVLNTELCKITD